MEGTEDKDLIPVQEKEQEEQERARALNRYPGGLLSGPGFPLARPSAGYQFAGQQPAPPGFPMYASNVPQMHMTSQPYVGQMMPTAPQPRPFNYGQQRTSMENFHAAAQPTAQMPSEQVPNPFADSYPELDLEQMGFGNRFGALEFSMLNEMSSGLVDTPTSDSVGGVEHHDSINYGGLPAEYGSSPAGAQQWRFPQPGSSQGAIAYNLGGQERDPFDGFVKQEARAGGLPPGSLQGQSSYPSPISGPNSGPSPQGMMAGFEGNPAIQEANTNVNSSHQAQGLLEASQSHQPQPDSGISASTIPATTPSTIPAPTLLTPNTYSRRSRNPSTVYNMVTEPHSYTRAFHDLMALIRKRFSQKRTAQIARALASIRPSFISSLTKLNDDDRIFMEKCLQRTLLEYEDNICLTGTPTILCRRTGEVVAVGEGFSILTGWKRAVLLGKEPNLNVNKGDATVSSDTGASTSRGTNTPSIVDGSNLDEAQLKPVSIVELLDDESACDFFDDYAHLAFGDSRGSVTTPCKLLKYKTAKDKSFDKDLDSEVGSRMKQQRDVQHPGRGEEEDGKVECMLCWSVKRDVFDIPMLFVMNVLPCI